ncbi:MAG: cell division protein FtsA [Candidatus Liptonbacteria bacterium]|nr:cell division protein FtsA [Candidatus Liptonbacteria bacterium]
MGPRFIVGLDIGTASAKIAAAELKNGKIILRYLYKEPTAGLRHGAVCDLAEAVPSVSRALEQVKRLGKAGLRAVYANIGTPQIKAQNCHGIVAVSRADNEIYQDDIDRAIKASEAVNLPPNRMVIHNVTREFVVDGVPDIGNPLGLSGNRLEVNSVIIDAFAPHVKNVMRLVELSGGDIGTVIFNPLAASRSALTKRQKELGVALVDIGFGTTSLAVYEENKLIGVQIFPVGAGNITNDLAVGLRIPVSAAENLKLQCGFAIASEVGSKENVELKKFVSGAKNIISRRFVSEIIESRLTEILEFVNNELKLMGKAGRLAGGVVFTGGGAKMPGLTELAKQELRLSSQIGFAGDVEKWAKEGDRVIDENMEDPEFATSIGLLLWGMDNEGWQPKEKEPFSSRVSWKGVKDIFRSFLP